MMDFKTDMKSLSKEECLMQIEKAKWLDSPICPYCFSTRSSKMKGSLRHHCNECNTSFSVTVNTIFHNSKLPLQKWFSAIEIMLDNNGNISAKKLQLKLNVTYKTAWYLVNRINRALREQKDFLINIVNYNTNS